MTLERYNHCVQRHLLRGYSCNEEAHETIGRKRIETAEDYCTGLNRGNSKDILETEQRKKVIARCPTKHRGTHGRDASIVSNETRAMRLEKSRGSQ